ncbi:hypothetical protein IGM_06477 [Bacillus cereus HuB4-4]|uniref:Uncharacterized protein n=1 Tax=Bacillus cereus HuB4-4 TaxID=1053211 RepID=A0A9W5QMY1_BACCE|nr:hypothetical protein [Bacillus cereus]EOP78870.1 hypothetical protein IGM_06477 [Bacillus cereus HuB4-4]
MIYLLLTLLACLFMFGIFTAFDIDKSENGKIIGVVLTVLSLIGMVVTVYLQQTEVNEKVRENNQKIEMITEYNEKKQNELLTEKFKLPITDILIESISETEWEYYKVTTNTGVYKIAFAYDSNNKIVGFKEFKQITSVISKESNHEQGSHN